MRFLDPKRYFTSIPQICEIFFCYFVVFQHPRVSRVSLAGSNDSIRERNQAWAYYAKIFSSSGSNPWTLYNRKNSGSEFRIDLLAQGQSF